MTDIIISKKCNLNTLPNNMKHYKFKFHLLSGESIDFIRTTENNLFDIITSFEDSNTYIYSLFKEGEEYSLSLELSITDLYNIDKPLYLLKEYVTNELFTLWNNSLKENNNIHELFYKKSLVLHQQYYSFKPLHKLTQLTELIIHHTKSHNICPLIYTSQLVNLKILELRNCTTVSALTNLKNIPQLCTLNIVTASNLLDISDLKYLKQLKNIKLWDCPRLSNIEPIQELLTLEEINMYNCINIIDIIPFHKLINLESIYLYKCHSISNIEPLVDLINIKSLELYSDDINYQLSNINAIKLLYNLELLKLRCNKDIDSNLLNNKILLNLVKLDTLELYNCCVIKDIVLPSNITVLYLYKCVLLNIKSIQHLKKLHTLTLELKYDSELRYIQELNILEYIDTLQALCSLTLIGLDVSDISILHKLPKLSILKLNKCIQISDITFIKTMITINRLDIIDCDILFKLYKNKELEFLYELENINKLTIIHNLLS